MDTIIGKEATWEATTQSTSGTECSQNISTVYLRDESNRGQL